ncbi:sodium:alanine symporter family protein [soil metagenome]
MQQPAQSWVADAQAVVGTLSGWVWGPPMLILLVGTGLYLSVLLRGLQFRELGHALYLAFVRRREHDAEGDISHFQALMTALAATVGTGNIAGVATAIATGGPGALFWMWITGLVGMATKYSEAVLGVRYRVVDSRGEMSGGPMYYLSRGIGGGLGRVLGGLFALFAAIAAFGIGNMVQSNSVADALQSSFGIDPLWTGLVIAILAGMVILGGIRSIGKFTGFFVPLMIAFYMAGALVVLAINWRGIPSIFVYVLQDAFSPAAAAGGFLGATLMMAIRMGVSRGVFSNESGLGTGGIAAAAAQTHQPVTQALVSMTQTFIDTIVVCSLTGFAIIATGSWMRTDPITGAGLTGAPLTIQAFSTGLPGTWGGYIVSTGLALFAFSTILGWAYYGERNVEYLIGVRGVLPYRLLFIVAAFLGAWVLTLPDISGFQLVWDFADVMNGLMAFPNLVGLLLLSGVVARETREYFGRARSPAEPVSTR